MKTWMKIPAIVLVAELIFLGVGAAMGNNVGLALAPLLLSLVATLVASWYVLRPLDESIQVVQKLAGGDLDVPKLEGEAEFGVLATAVNGVQGQMNEIAKLADELASGRIGVVDIEDRVMKSGSMVDAEIPLRTARSDLERSFFALTNQMRRMTIQARVIAQDELSSPLLDERVPGELGDAFALMVRNLRGLSEHARQIARGDLREHGEPNGDLSGSFFEMTGYLRQIVDQIITTALHISSSAEQMQAVLRDQELAAAHQATGVEETQRTMETLLTSARRIAEGAQQVFQSAERVGANNRTTAERISELKEQTERITESLEVINTIAERSDLLALNASLEGLRAGEAGKGFSLVANEMRRLAESIKETVSDIKTLVGDIRETSVASVMTSEEGTNLSEKNTETALKITLITQQQQSGTEQVTQSMNELSMLINHGLSGTKQVTTAATDLVKMSEDLRRLVDKFELGSRSEEINRERDIRATYHGIGLGSYSDVFATKSSEKERKISFTPAAVPSVNREEISEASESKSTQKPKADELPEEVKTQSLRRTMSLVPMSIDEDDPPTVEFDADVMSLAFQSQVDSEE